MSVWIWIFGWRYRRPACTKYTSSCSRIISHISQLDAHYYLSSSSFHLIWQSDRFEFIIINDIIYWFEAASVKRIHDNLELHCGGDCVCHVLLDILAALRLREIAFIACQSDCSPIRCDKTRVAYTHRVQFVFEALRVYALACQAGDSAPTQQCPLATYTLVGVEWWSHHPSKYTHAHTNTRRETVGTCRSTLFQQNGSICGTKNFQSPTNPLSKRF